MPNFNEMKVPLGDTGNTWKDRQDAHVDQTALHYSDIQEILAFLATTPGWTPSTNPTSLSTLNAKIATTSDDITYVITDADPYTSHVDDMWFIVQFPTTPKAYTQLQVDSLVAKSIYKDGAAVQYGDLKGTHLLVYNATDGVFHVVGNITTKTPNDFIDGDFDFWPEGASFSIAGYTSAAMKIADAGGTEGYIVSQQAFPVGQTEVEEQQPYYLRTVISNGGNVTTGYIRHEILLKDVAKYADRDFTIAGNFFFEGKDVAIEFVQDFGTGGAPSADVTGIGVTKFAAPTQLQRQDITVALPSISGGTLGTNGDDHLKIIIWLSAGSDFNTRTSTLGIQTGTFKMSHMRFNQGRKSHWHERDVDAEALKVSRIVYEYTQPLVFGSGYASTTTNARIAIFLPTEMDRDPTVSIGAIANVRLVGEGASGTVLTLAFETLIGNCLGLLLTSVLIVQNQPYILKIINSDKLLIDARL